MNRAGDGRGRWLRLPSRVRHLAVLAALLAGSHADVVVGKSPSGQGIAEIHDGHHAGAMVVLRPLALKGKPDAQYHLGLIYFEGRGVDENLPEAARWFRAAAEQGHAQAQVTLAFMHETGRGVVRDFTASGQWYSQAAAAYASGRGVDQDTSEAARLYELAAMLGEPQAQFLLGAWYAEGRGVDQDHTRSLYWLALAAQKGNTEASAKIDAAIDGGHLRAHKVLASAVNLRAAPHRDAEVLGSLTLGAAVYLLDDADEQWVEVYVPAVHQLGYVAGRFVAPDGGRP